MNNNKTQIVRLKNFFNQDKSRYSILIVIAISILILGITIYTSINNGGHTPQWVIWVSFISSVFGMITVTTYSIMDLEDEKKRNKYKVFIIFNTIGLTTLAAINIHTQLWILAVQNFICFFIGCYQFYNWFIKTKKEKEISNFTFKRFNSEDGFICVSAILLAALFISIISGQWTSDKTSDTYWLYKHSFSYLLTRTFLDSILGVSGILGALMVSRKRAVAIWIYVISNSLLIALWASLLILSSVGSKEFVNHAGISVTQSINMIGLFTFYNLTNILLVKKWYGALEPKVVKNK